MIPISLSEKSRSLNFPTYIEVGNITRNSCNRNKFQKFNVNLERCSAKLFYCSDSIMCLIFFIVSDRQDGAIPKQF